MKTLEKVPVFTEDPYSESALLDPYPFLDRLAAAGPVSYLEATGIYAITGYEEVYEVLTDFETYVSSGGLGPRDIRKDAGWRPPSILESALLQRLAAVRGRLSLCADQAAAAKWWLSMPMASVSAEGPMPKALSTRRTSPLMPGCRHQGRACPLRRARMTSNPLIVA